jgi:hypothetical protein
MLTGSKAAKAMRGKRIKSVDLRPWGRVSSGTGPAHAVAFTFDDGSCCTFMVQETKDASDYGVTPHYHEITP